LWGFLVGRAMRRGLKENDGSSFWGFFCIGFGYVVTGSIALIAVSIDGFPNVHSQGIILVSLASIGVV